MHICTCVSGGTVEKFPVWFLNDSRMKIVKDESVKKWCCVFYLKLFSLTLLEQF